MAFKNQLTLIKNNWLIIVIIIVLLLFINMGSLLLNSSANLMDSSLSKSPGGYSADYMAESAYYGNTPSSSNYLREGGDFAPDVQDRKITKTGRVTTEVPKGEFTTNENHFKEIVTSSGSLMLSENVNKQGSGRREYYTGTYQLKVESDKYTPLISQLKKIGKIESSYENAQDITGQYENTKINIEVEKQRLARYNEMYLEAENIQDKIDLNDRIFNQERSIKYLEDSLKNQDQRVDYSTIYFTLKEKQSEYANIVFVKFSSLIKSFVNSLNSLLSFIFVIAPWVIFLIILRIIWKFIKRKKIVRKSQKHN